MNYEKVSKKNSEEKQISFKTDKELKELAKKACMNKLFIATYTSSSSQPKCILISHCC